MREFCVTLKTVCEANRAGSEHWRARWKRSKAQKEAMAWFLRRYVGRDTFAPGWTFSVRLTRIAPGNGLDVGDNLNSSMKYVRDSIAEYYGVDDGSPLVTWLYAQERGKPGEYAVRVQIWRVQ